MAVYQVAVIIGDLVMSNAECIEREIVNDLGSAR